MKRRARTTSRILGISLVAAVAFLGAASPSRGTAPSSYTVTDLGQVTVTGINDAGHVVYFSGITAHSYLWVNGTATDMGAFVAQAINATDVVVGNTTGSTPQPVEWTSGGGLVTLPLLPGWDSATPMGINASGVITGVATSSFAVGFDHALVWNSASSTPTDLDGSITDTCQFSKGHAINASGQVAAEGRYSPIADCNSSTRFAAYLMNAGTTQLTPAGNSPGVGKAINDSGVVVGSIRVSGDDRPFMYDGTLHDLTGVTGIGTNGSAYAINNSGDIVGFSAPGGFVPASGWLYQNGTVTNLLTLTGIQLVPAGINDSGQIVARETASQHSYLLTPVYPDADLAASLHHTPEPSTIDVGTDKAHVVWTARLTNNGPGQADGAHLTVTLPSGFSLSSGGLDSHCTGTGPFTCTPSGGTLANGAHVDFTIAADASVPVNANASAGVSSTTNDPTSGNDSATDLTTVNVPAPTFTPASGRAGAAVTISGAAFTGATVVDFHGSHASFTVASDTEIDATVPAGAISGTITIVTPAGTWVTAQPFRVLPKLRATLLPPLVQKISPLKGEAGVTVTIDGQNFSGASRVAFNGTPAAYAVVSDKRVTAVVPSGAATGPVSVTTSAGTGKSPTAFTVLPPVPPVPAITDFSPLSGPRGMRVTIHGSGFLNATAVRFNGVQASFRVVSNSTISAVVPRLATTGRITVTTPGGTATSAQSFVI